MDVYLILTLLVPVIFVGLLVAFLCRSSFGYLHGKGLEFRIISQLSSGESLLASVVLTQIRKDGTKVTGYDFNNATVRLSKQKVIKLAPVDMVAASETNIHKAITIRLLGREA